MTTLREPGEPGRHMPTMDHICGFDGRDNDSPVCGKPATTHLFAGSPETGPGDFAMMACPAHTPQAQSIAWDWHEMSAVCDVPGTKWQAKARQGEGFCYWPEAEAATHEALAEQAETAGGTKR